MPELGGDTPLETCLAEARAAGFVGIELGNKFPKEPGALRPIMDRHGLSLVSGWYGSELRTRSVEEEIAAMTPHLDLLAAIGTRSWCSVLEVLGTCNRRLCRRRPAADCEAEWEPFAISCRRRRAHGGQGVTAGLPPPHGTVIDKSHRFDRRWRPPEVFACSTYTVLTFAGEDPAAMPAWATARAHPRQGLPSEVLARGWPSALVPRSWRWFPVPPRRLVT